MSRKARFPIGLEFVYHADKQKRQRQIIDILTTTSTKTGEVVRIEYVTAYAFLGQQMTENLVDTGIARSLSPAVLALYA